MLNIDAHRATLYGLEHAGFPLRAVWGRAAKRTRKQLREEVLQLGEFSPFMRRIGIGTVDNIFSPCRDNAVKEEKLENACQSSIALDAGVSITRPHPAVCTTLASDNDGSHTGYETRGRQGGQVLAGSPKYCIVDATPEAI